VRPPAPQAGVRGALSTPHCRAASVPRAPKIWPQSSTPSTTQPIYNRRPRRTDIRNEGVTHVEHEVGCARTLGARGGVSRVTDVGWSRRLVACVTLAGLQSCTHAFAPSFAPLQVCLMGRTNTFPTLGDAEYSCISVADRKAGTMSRMVMLVSPAVAAEAFMAAARPSRLRACTIASARRRRLMDQHASIHGCDAC
jgi:hypothetical protein